MTSSIGWRTGSPEVSEIGGWGGGVFNGGAWLQIDGLPVDVHYRDLDVVEHELAEAQHGRFRVEPLLFHLAGIPSYLVVGELAINKVLRGDLPAPDYPTALREKAAQEWWANAEQSFTYAATGHAPYGRVAQCAGLRDVDGIVLSLSAGAEQLQQANEQARALCKGVFRG
jgi:hypothetical protein